MTTKISPYEKSGKLQALLNLLLESADKLLDDPSEFDLRLARASVERIRKQAEECQLMDLDYGYIPREVNNESA